MGEPAIPLFVSYDEYIALERSTDQKHEWVDGVAYAMAGGTLPHGDLCAQLIVELARIIGENPCRIYTADVKVRTRVGNFASYPDVSVVCGGAQTHPDDPNAVTNPVVLVEVLSDSTEGWDRAGKFRRYKKIESLRDYVLVSQHEPVIEVYSRGADGAWILREAEAGGRVPLSAFEGSLEVDRVYRGVTLEARVGR